MKEPLTAGQPVTETQTKQDNREGRVCFVRVEGPTSRLTGKGPGRLDRAGKGTRTKHISTQATNHEVIA